MYKNYKDCEFSLNYDLDQYIPYPSRDRQGVEILIPLPDGRGSDIHFSYLNGAISVTVTQTFTLHLFHV